MQQKPADRFNGLAPTLLSTADELLLIGKDRLKESYLGRDCRLGVFEVDRPLKKNFCYLFFRDYFYSIYFSITFIVMILLSP